MSYEPEEPEWMAGQVRGGQQPPGGRTGGRGARFQKKEDDRGKYVEVDQRILEFYGRYPDGRLESEIHTLRVDGYEVQERTYRDGNQTKTSKKPVLLGVVVVLAKAYRTPDDPHPGTGHSWMVMPGTTPYTVGSELENAETSAWGRAIAACGIAVREGIATRQEVESKRDEDEPEQVSTAGEVIAAAAREGRGAPVPPEATATAGEGHVGPEGHTDTPTATDGAPVSRERPRRTTPPVQPSDETAKIAQTVPTAVVPAAVPEGELLSFELFVAKCRERFIPAPTISAQARELYGDSAGSIRELTDQQRGFLWVTLEAVLSAGAGKG